MSLGKSIPMNTILLSFFSLGSDMGPKWLPNEKKLSKMVFIGIDLPKDILLQGLEGCLV